VTTNDDIENQTFDPTPDLPNTGLNEVVPVSGLYENWFLDYASYVILERAVPAIEDGLKPVQRRILHAMKDLDDGRFNKVANIIGTTMQFHPHGDASIGDAIVNLGQKDLLIECQGNWGDVRTGDGAAAPRYIEARLSKFALEVVYNPQTTRWQLSYDGRKKEPITFPVKFPLLLALGVEGIAVGLSTKILPHNFCELLEACIDHLNGKPINLIPDFMNGGMIDATQYNNGRKGSKVRVRAHIEDVDRKMLIIRDIPFGVTTVSVMDSIVKANDAGKIKIKKVVDNTAKDVEIQVHLAPGTSPDITIDALYAFTDCEVSISPNACVVHEDKPQFLGVDDLLKHNVAQTMELLRQELLIREGELLERILFSSLERIFIENRIYRDIEECTTWESVLETIDKGLEPYKPQFYRVIVRDDILKLTEIKIKRISKYDSFKADELLKAQQAELDEVRNNLAHLKQYTLSYYRNLLKKYGKGRERKTEIKQFDVIAASVVAANNQKLYVNRAEGFVGYGLKKDEYVSDCSDMDDVIVFLKNGKYRVIRIGEKVFVGKDIEYLAVFRKNDDRMVYHAIYVDGETGYSMAKRFQVLGVTRDKDYDVTRGVKGSKMHYFSANPNGESEVLDIMLTPGSSAKVKRFDYDFGKLDIKGRASQGNIVTKYAVKKVTFKLKGKSTLAGVDIWYDPSIGKLNSDKRGKNLGQFDANDHILVLYKSGQYELTSFDLTNRYDPEQIILLERYQKGDCISAVYYEGGLKAWYLKRFIIETTTVDKKFDLLPDSKGTYLLAAAQGLEIQLEVTCQKDKKAPIESNLLDPDLIADIKGVKALGSKLSYVGITSAKFIIPQQEPEEATTPKEQVAETELLPETPSDTKGQIGLGF
jgi:topoisomerase-4 subunit A